MAILTLIIVYIFEFQELELQFALEKRAPTEKFEEEKSDNFKSEKKCTPLKSYVFLKKHKCASSSFQEGFSIRSLN